MVSESSKLGGVGGDFGCGFGCGSEQIIIHYWEQAQAKHHNTQGSIPANLWSTYVSKCFTSFISYAWEPQEGESAWPGLPPSEREKMSCPLKVTKLVWP